MHVLPNYTNKYIPILTFNISCSAIPIDVPCTVITLSGIVQLARMLRHLSILELVVVQTIRLEESLLESLS